MRALIVTTGRVALLCASMVLVCATLVGGVMGLGYVVLWTVSFLPEAAEGFLWLAVKVGLGIVLFLACGCFGLVPPRRNGEHGHDR